MSNSLNELIQEHSWSKFHPLTIFPQNIELQWIKKRFTIVVICTKETSIIAYGRLTLGGKQCIKMGNERYIFFPLMNPPLKERNSQPSSHLTMYIKCAQEISEFEDSEKM